MSSNNNKRKAKQLGMPYGTACGRLRKAILFSLVQETGRDICFKCGEVIENVSELSIEHMAPWLGNDTALFWDLENIAFSHLGCNRPDRVTSKPRWSPEGESWCNSCKQFKELSEFHKSSSRYNGASYTCKACSREYKRKNRWTTTEVKAKACKQCGETSPTELLPNRRFCKKCYNELQRIKMEKRRRLGIAKKRRGD